MLWLSGNKLLSSPKRERERETRRERKRGGENSDKRLAGWYGWA
jgi:hypothetical protein